MEKEESEGTVNQGTESTGTLGGDSEENAPVGKKSVSIKKVMELVTDIAKSLGELSKRVEKIDAGGIDKFKTGAKAEDIEKAALGREGIDPRIVRLVDEILGDDFAVRMEPNNDKPGFKFSVVVPERLSPNKSDMRPKLKKDAKGPRDYETRPDGSFVMEEYIPEDIRSIAVSSSQSFDPIKKHCEKVRSNIVAYYQKMQSPIPEFKLKSHGV